jgi:hypothetical protein
MADTLKMVQDKLAGILELKTYRRYAGLKSVGAFTKHLQGFGRVGKKGIPDFAAHIAREDANGVPTGTQEVPRGFAPVYAQMRVALNSSEKEAVTNALKSVQAMVDESKNGGQAIPYFGDEDTTAILEHALVIAAEAPKGYTKASRSRR